MNLTMEDFHSLRDGKELSDKIVNAAQHLLKQQFSNICGFQSTLLGQNLSFKAIPSNCHYVQILHTGIVIEEFFNFEFVDFMSGYI